MNVRGDFFGVPLQVLSTRHKHNRRDMQKFKRRIQGVPQSLEAEHWELLGQFRESDELAEKFRTGATKTVQAKGVKMSIEQI